MLKIITYHLSRGNLSRLVGFYIFVLGFRVVTFCIYTVYFSVVCPFAYVSRTEWKSSY